MLTIVSTASRAAVYTTALTDLKDKLDIPAAETFKDAELTRILKSAFNTVERETHRSLFYQTFKLETWGFHTIHIPKPPFIELTGNLIRYYDSEDDVQTLDADAYEVTTDTPAFLWFRDEEVSPIMLSDDRPYPLEVNYVAGYGDNTPAAADLPEDLYEGILLLAYHRFKYPDACHPGVPEACKHYLEPFYFRDHKSDAEVTA